jgi:hypothetical protein
MKRDRKAIPRLSARLVPELLLKDDALVSVDMAPNETSWHRGKIYE